MQPVDGHRAVVGHRGRIQQHAAGHRGVGGAANSEQVLVGPGGSLDDEQVLAGNRHGQGGRQCRERGKALVPPIPAGSGSERLAGTCVVEGDPLGNVGGLAVLQPPIRIRHLDAVIDVGLDTAP